MAGKYSGWMWRSAMGVLLAVAGTVQAASEIVVYSARNEQLIKPLFDLYTKETGTKIKYITDGEGPLIARLEAEGARTPADLMITVDAGNLWLAAEKGLFRPIESAALESVIPAQYQDSGNRWFGLSVRARTIVYSPERVKTTELSSYEDLADPKWKGRLCLRTSKKVYNQSLVATMIERHGEAKTQQIVEGWIANLATPVFANDTALVEAIAAGQCDVGIVNTYYFGRLQREKPAVAARLYWPNQDSSGVHVNVSGAGITTHAKRPEAAQAFLEWLAQREAQEIFAGINLEYPVNADTRWDPIVESWGKFKADDLNVEVAGRRQIDAVKLMDRAGYL